MRKTLLTIRMLLLLLFLGSSAGSLYGLSAAAETTTETDILSGLSINFRPGSSVLKEDYRTNSSSFEKLDKVFSDSAKVSHLSAISIMGTSSPDGNPQANARFAKERAEAIRDYLIRRYPGLKFVTINLHIIPEDWDGLRSLIESDPSMPYRTKALDIIDNEADPVRRESRLRQLGQGTAWGYIVKEYLDLLRAGSADIKLEWKTTLPPPPPPPPVIEKRDTVIREIIREVIVEKIIVPDTVIIITPAPPKEEDIVPPFTDFDTHRIVRPIAFKSNLLFLLGSALNVELEIPLAKRWSLAAEVVCPWWLLKGDQYAMQLLWGNLELRYWFKPNFKKQDEKINPHNPLSGWFAGVYGGGGYYDLEGEKKGYQGEFFTAGLTGGYVLPLNRSFNMEFSLGVGYMQSDYRYYEARQDVLGDWHLIKQYPGQLTWIGPTRAKISLSWYPHIKTKKRGGNK